MRLTGGTGKGRRLYPPPSGVRPTSSRLRETLFQLVKDRLAGATVLDLFAGSGVLGLEALARGAEHATFIEKGLAAVKIIRKNLEICGFQERSDVIQGEIPRVLRMKQVISSPFDLIFTDPPYFYPTVNLLFETIRYENLLVPEGLMIYECSSRESNPEPEGWNLRDVRKFGDTKIMFYK